MSQADLATRPSTNAADAESDLAGAELRLAMLKRLASLGMRVAEEVAERMVSSPYHPEPRHEPARAFAAISRAVRLTIVLEARVEADLFAMRRGEVPKAMAAPEPRPRVAARTSDDDDDDVDIDDDGGVEAVARERTWESLVDREDHEALLDLPFDETVGTIRRTLERRGADEETAEAPPSLPALGRVETKQSEVRGGAVRTTVPTSNRSTLPHPARFASRPSP